MIERKSWKGFQSAVWNGKITEMGKNFEYLNQEEKFIHEALVASRKVQEFLWGDFNCSSANFEEFKRMYRKRLVKLEEIRPDNPHALIEAKKRILQIAAISINFLCKIESKSLTNEPVLPSNLPQFGEKIECTSVLVGLSPEDFKAIREMAEQADKTK
jgi:hypothetical protein